MFDALEFPEPTRVIIPRHRNGDLIYSRVGSVDEERARLLGIAAVMIAELKNTHMFMTSRVDVADGYAGIEARYSLDLIIEKVEEAMQVLMDHGLDAFEAILDGLMQQSEAEQIASRLFAQFVNEIK